MIYMNMKKFMQINITNNNQIKSNIKQFKIIDKQIIKILLLI